MMIQKTPVSVGHATGKIVLLWNFMMCSVAFGTFIIPIPHQPGRHGRTDNKFYPQQNVMITTAKTTKLNLLSFNLNNGKSNGVNGNNNHNKKNEDDDDDDVLDELESPDWVEALRQWPLYPQKNEGDTSKSSNSQEQEKDSASTAKNVGSTSPIANLINVEALLMASGAEFVEDISDLDLFTSLGGGGNSVSLPQKTNIDYQENGTITRSKDQPVVNKQSTLPILAKFEELGNWGRLSGTIQRSIAKASNTTAIASQQGSSAASLYSMAGITPESILQAATARIDSFVSEATIAVSPSAVQEMIFRLSQTLPLEENVNSIVQAAEKLALEQGLDVKEAADRARETTKYTTELVTLANGVLTYGYIAGDNITDTSSTVDTATATTSAGNVAQQQPKPLFHNFASVAAIDTSDYKQTVTKGAEMGSLSAAVYEDVIERSHAVNHGFVANGTTSDVDWMITDSIAYEDEFRSSRGGSSSSSSSTSSKKQPTMVRTITIQGFDASDEDIDRERLLNTICTATPEPFGDDAGIVLHSGLLSLARDIYQDIMKYVDMTAPTHRIAITGHSIGGAISILLLLLMTEDRGVEFVEEKVLRVFTYGAPAVAAVSDSVKPEVKKPFLGGINKNVKTEEDDDMYRCDILSAFNLPTSIVYGYVQPWDPIVRLFTTEDPLYPLVDDIGEDGFTVWASGPPRTLRPVVKTITQAWAGWPRFRDNYAATSNPSNQAYHSVGVQHLLLPDRTRYLSDRLVSVNVAVPPIETVLRISSKELLPALKETFPLDVFSISFVPQAIRSFVHHFYPAYFTPVVMHASKKQMQKTEQPLTTVLMDQQPSNGNSQSTPAPSPANSDPDPVRNDGTATDKVNKNNIDWAGVATQWILGGANGDLRN